MFGFFSSKSNNSPEQADAVLQKFIDKAPKNTYTFDSERGADESQICREPGGGMKKECIQIHLQSKALFEAMQAQGFFCALPMDPKRTHMECKPLLPK